MDARLCEKVKDDPIRENGKPALRAPTGVTVYLRADNKLPAFETPQDELGAANPSPLRGLTVTQRQDRLVGLLELLASYGDGAAAAKALDHIRWQVEMRRGKAPQRVDLNASGSITVLNTLADERGTPIPPAKPRPPRSSGRAAEKVTSTEID